MAADRHIIGRIGEHHLRLLLAEQRRINVGLCGIATDEAMPADRPDIASPRDRRPRRDRRHLICGIGLAVLFAERQLADEHVDLRQLEAGDGEIEVDVEVGEILELDREQVPIPAGILGELVVGDHISADIRLAHARQLDGRDRHAAEQLRGRDTAMPGDDAVRIIDQDRIGESEPPDRRGDLLNLLCGMRARIACSGLQRRNRLVDNGTLCHAIDSGENRSELLARQSAAPDKRPRTTPWPCSAMDLLVGRIDITSQLSVPQPIALTRTTSRIHNRLRHGKPNNHYRHRQGIVKQIFPAMEPAQMTTAHKTSVSQ